ncbi:MULTISPECIES: hypothetical protein [Lacticaseibacillus]|uniref:Uncharacterized protein n=2 Tax=Lacticaseibacillus zeae TaxID=57037 RepID=A0A5R8LRK4_LACZE|nr:MULTISPECIES: hypothetical protein [Lacticaseibacillus]OFR93104.1 hypothetical protein HMPREF2861_11635 [Lactobacillus sp. HMSC068F07]KLI76995.1 hypothetical protein AAW28_00610 [Lacticaseibacillus casei]MDE3283389.1 hypothetical protein [Lacticaseibacillus casei]MDE3316082.1 hypothetical protein [Lacticaseibacillus zeae]OLS06412.1 hypothetical protein AUQ39_10225 [Lacticaseibacillus casei]
MTFWDIVQIMFAPVVIIWIIATSKGKIDRRTKELIWIVVLLVIVGNVAGYIIATERSHWAIAYNYTFAFIQLVIMWSFARNF